MAYAGWRMSGGVLKWSLIVRSGSGWATAYSSVSPSLGRWYSVELHWKSDASNGLGELYVDGQRIVSLTGQNTASYGGANSVRFGLGEADNCGSASIYVDHLVVSPVKNL